MTRTLAILGLGLLAATSALAAGTRPLPERDERRAPVQEQRTRPWELTGGVERETGGRLVPQTAWIGGARDRRDVFGRAAR